MGREGQSIGKYPSFSLSTTTTNHCLLMLTRYWEVLVMFWWNIKNVRHPPLLFIMSNYHNSKWKRRFRKFSLIWPRCISTFCSKGIWIAAFLHISTGHVISYLSSKQKAPTGDDLDNNNNNSWISLNLTSYDGILKTEIIIGPCKYYFYFNIYVDTVHQFLKLTHLKF